MRKGEESGGCAVAIKYNDLCGMCQPRKLVTARTFAITRCLKETYFSLFAPKTFCSLYIMQLKAESKLELKRNSRPLTHSGRGRGRNFRPITDE